MMKSRLFSSFWQEYHIVKDIAPQLTLNIPTLSSSSVKKCYTVLMAGFETALKWHYIASIPHVTAPAEKNVKRRAWEAGRVYEVLQSIQEDKLLHLVVHLAFVCSLRAGEIAGIDIRTIDVRDRCLWITRQVQRVSDTALSVLPKNEIIRVFPKLIHTSKSSLILKGPKTEDSHRKQYLTAPLIREIQERLAEIEEYKRFFGSEYHDYGLLICQPDGRPIDPKNLESAFREHQARISIPYERESIFKVFASLVRCIRFVCRRMTISLLLRVPVNRRKF